jgi:hypothetical protein
MFDHHMSRNVTVMATFFNLVRDKIDELEYTERLKGISSMLLITLQGTR